MRCHIRHALHLFVGIVVVTAILSSTSTPSRAAQVEAEKKPEWLFVQNSSQRGAELMLKKNGTGTLVMNANHPGIVAFTDRPYREAKLISMFAMAKTWKKGTDSFAVDPPNAILSGMLWGEAHSVGLELLTMKARKVGPTRWQTTFKVKLLHVAGDHTFQNKLPARGVKMSVSGAALFIDGFWDWLDDAVKWVDKNIIQPIVKTAEQIIQEVIAATQWVIGQTQDIYAIASKFAQASVDQAKIWVANLGADGVFDMLWHVIALVLGFVVPGPTTLNRLSFLFNNGMKISDASGLGSNVGCFADFKATTYCGSYLTELVDQIYNNMPRPMLDWMVAKQNVADGLIKLTNAIHSAFAGLVCATAPRAAAIDGVSKALAQVIIFGDGPASQQRARDFVSGSGYVVSTQAACPLA